MATQNQGNKIKKGGETMKELSEMSIDELRALQSALQVEVSTRTADLVHCTFETNRSYDPRKHGHAYVATINKDESGRPLRGFLNNAQRAYDSKHKYYDARWEADLAIGTKVEARLDEGSWKNESRSYFIVQPDGLHEVTRQAVLGI